MEWTTEVPNADGYYWVKDEGGSIEIVYVQKEKDGWYGYSTGGGDLNYWPISEWKYFSGPIKEPE